MRHEAGDLRLAECHRKIVNHHETRDGRGATGRKVDPQLDGPRGHEQTFGLTLEGRRGDGARPARAVAVHVVIVTLQFHVAGIRKREGQTHGSSVRDAVKLEPLEIEHVAWHHAGQGEIPIPLTVPARVVVQ